MVVKLSSLFIGCECGLVFKTCSFLMGASCGGDTQPKEEPVFASVGLQTHHAYSVLDVKDVHGIR